MGIYSNGSIFGISIYKFNDDDLSNEQMSETYLFYNELSDKNNVFFKIYTECIFDKIRYLKCVKG